MRVTVIVAEDRVNVEGFSESVNCSALFDEHVHVIQWYGDHGEIEYWHAPNATTFKAPKQITDFTPYQYLVDAWEIESKKETVLAA